ncbi:hypothetical protein GUJ93_ZPchr0009g1051 [Zizania palustris]|uniref:Uncharacterized protein n=1 Tax=Zizania palustris TaxID=103762 RepID=A0A8J5RN80_ZIZPA|nr:hypothetical protein GUJ93_ZPchr0009g1051 [Zizania palustris]
MLTGVTTLYNTGLTFGGLATMTFGWFVAGTFTMVVGLSMAKIYSSFPTFGLPQSLLLERPFFWQAMGALRLIDHQMWHQICIRKGLDKNARFAKPIGKREALINSFKRVIGEKGRGWTAQMYQQYPGPSDLFATRTSFPMERHLFVQGINTQGDSGLVLSTDAKPRLKWTPELHQRFVDTVNQVGEQRKLLQK